MSPWQIAVSLSLEKVDTAGPGIKWLLPPHRVTLGGLLTVWSLQGLEGSSSPGLHFSSSNSCADYELLKPAYQGPPRFQASMEFPSQALNHPQCQDGTFTRASCPVPTVVPCGLAAPLLP